MAYALTVFSFDDRLSLYIPDPSLLRAAYENLRQRDPATPFPFWARIWPSGFVLADFLKERSELIAGKKLLELGAGIGLPSFLAAQWAAEVMVSDHNTEAVELMKRNIDHLACKNVSARQLDWNHLTEIPDVDILLLSDTNYDAAEFAPLLRLIRSAIEANITVIIATPQRINIAPFAGALQSFIQHSELRLHEGTEIRVMILSNASY